MKRREMNVGQKYSMLTIIEELPIGPNGRVFKCQCDCGNTKNVLLQHLVRLKIQSCGCYRIKARIKHDKWESREYSTWENMVQRCTNLNAVRYDRYGGRGISVCDRWIKSFINFYEDMGPRPLNTTLDRRDPNKGYYKENCRWATQREQLANLGYYGVPVIINNIKQPTEEWIKELGIDREVFKSRVLRGLGFKAALSINVDIIALEIAARRQVIYHLDTFLKETKFDKEKVLKLLDSDHEEPYHGLLLRYLLGFKGWPEKHCSE